MTLKLIRIERLKLLACMHGVKGASLYSLIGKSAAQTHNLLSGYASFGEKVARSIEEAAKLPTGWLDQVDDVPRDERRPRRPGALPLLTEAQAGHYQDYLDGPDEVELFLASVPVGPHTFALDVTGDAMAPDFVAGVRLIVEPDLAAQPGDYVLAKVEGEVSFKQLIRDGSDRYLKPANPRYPLKPLGQAELLGVVRATSRFFR